MARYVKKLDQIRHIRKLMLILQLNSNVCVYVCVCVCAFIQPLYHRDDGLQGCVCVCMYIKIRDDHSKMVIIVGSRLSSPS